MILYHLVLMGYIGVDNLFNSIKGGVVSYLCGLKTSTSLENQSLILSLTSLEKHDCWIEYYSYDGRRKRDRLFSI